MSISILDVFCAFDSSAFCRMSKGQGRKNQWQPFMPRLRSLDSSIDCQAHQRLWGRLA